MRELKILSKVFHENRGYFFFYKRNIVTEMIMKFICEHYNSEGNPPPVKISEWLSIRNES